MRKIFTIAIMLCVLFTITACTTKDNDGANIPPPPTNPVPSTDLAGYVECKDPRPEICTLEYMPVCAYAKNGSTYTAGNKCSACGDSEVTGYVEHACAGDEDNALPENKPIGGDKDAHGCLIAAGYTWCDAKQKCLRTWEESCASNPVQCNDPRPEMCTKEYMPVCAQKDNGIRCITAPCPNIENVTYGNKCTACSDKDVYSYVEGSCESQGTGSEPTSPKEKTWLCEGDCKEVESCPAGYDMFYGQIGKVCIKPITEETIKTWKLCSTQKACTANETCLYAEKDTAGNKIAWLSKSQGFRCAPGEYFGYLVNGGVTTRNEYGVEAVAIA